MLPSTFMAPIRPTATWDGGDLKTRDLKGSRIGFPRETDHDITMEMITMDYYHFMDYYY
jgi:hypothetical protein